MRVLVHPHSFLVGGSQLNAVDLASAVQRRGHEVLLFGESGPLVEVAAGLGLQHVESCTPRVHPSPSVGRQLCQVVREHGVDLVHAYEWPPSMDAVYGPGLRLGTPVVSTVMSMSVAPFIPAQVPLIVGTQQILNAERDRRGVVHLLEPPVDTELDRPGDRLAHRSRFGLHESDFVVTVVSRLAAELKLEGLLDAVRAVERLAQDLPVRLLVVGDGPSRDEVEAQAEHVNARCGRVVVTLTGMLLDPRPAYLCADVALGMGGSALRAGATGRPVVVQGEGGFWSVLTARSLPVFLHQGWYGRGGGGDGALVLEPLLRSLAGDPSRREELGAFARRTVCDRFSLQRAAVIQEEIYLQAREQWPARRTQLLRLSGPLAKGLTYEARRKVARRRGRASADDCNASALVVATAGIGVPP